MDIQIQNEGSIILFRPMNANAQQWLEEHTEDPWFFGALAVEHRYAADLAAGLQEEGFTVS